VGGIFKSTTYIGSKHVNAKISANEIGVHDVDIPKYPFDDSRDTPEIVL